MWFKIILTFKTSSSSSFTYNSCTYKSCHTSYHMYNRTSCKISKRFCKLSMKPASSSYSMNHKWVNPYTHKSWKYSISKKDSSFSQTSTNNSWGSTSKSSLKIPIIKILSSLKFISCKILSSYKPINAWFYRTKSKCISKKPSENCPYCCI